MNATTHKYAGSYELWWRPFSFDGTIHPPARSSDADRTGICQLPPPRKGKDEAKSGGTTAPQVNAEPSRQHEDWRQSAVADAPNTVDQSPASNAKTNASERKPVFAFVREIEVASTPRERRPTPVTDPNGDPIDGAKSGLINVELPRRSIYLCRRRRWCSGQMRLFQLLRGIHLLHPLSSVLVE
ncbi:hypothetical protein MOQ_007499 [Trypanosoma cruzi marinkellei]|uniref:Uncharacterized protein n=1 Tax=Trypanosoma cruzi marinkellei TaxID=85056 RepID=K2M1C1_TRYCR|nr:hypothetical protein MOQ_007499 [Trypanosoma cruzi marinkellei]